MPNLNAEINLDSLYCMFKGEAGLRKSTAALSFPTPQYWFSFDKKMRSLLLPMRALKLDPKLVDYDDYIDWDKPRAKLEQLQLNCKYKTIIIDSVTSCADAILSQGKKMKGGSDKGKKINNIQVNSIEDYNAEDSALSELVALTKDIHDFHKVNIILIAHVMEVQQKVGTETYTSRTIVTAGKRISIKIPSYCEEVYHFNIEKAIEAAQEGIYTCLTRHTGDDFARTSLPLPKLIKFGDEPLYEKWVYPAIINLRASLTQQSITTPTTK